jgi:hypothetical protein
MILDVNIILILINKMLCLAQMCAYGIECQN